MFPLPRTGTDRHTAPCSEPSLIGATPIDMSRRKIRVRQLYWILGLTLIAIVLTPLVRLLWHPPTTVQTPTKEPPLPWSITFDEAGRPSVFGLVLDSSTVADVLQHLGKDGQWAILERPGNPPVLEAYYPDFIVGRIEGKLILRFSGDPEALSREFTRHGRAEPTASGARKVEVGPESLSRLSRLPLTLITFLPKAQIDEAILRERYGSPAHQWLEEETKVQHYLYPERGIHILRTERGRTVIEYTTPERLRRHLSIERH